jgi:hypothetical protein
MISRSCRYYSDIYQDVQDQDAIAIGFVLCVCLKLLVSQSDVSETSPVGINNVLIAKLDRGLADTCGVLLEQ